MTDSGAVYQPTTVGYTYDTGGDGTVGGSRLRNGFLRIVSRRKISLKKWFEWVLLSVALCFFVAGLTMILFSFVSTDDPVQNTPGKEESEQTSTTMATETKEHVNNESGSSIAFDITMILVGLLMGSAWVWMRFFRRSKSPRNGIIGNSGQMLGGLNPSTDLLVGSTSQYGPVLTELPSQLKLKQVVTPHDVSTAIPLSDQEEETRTLMQDSTVPSTISAGPTSITNQIPG